MDAAESARILANALKRMALELQVAEDLAGLARELALGRAVCLASVCAHWKADGTNLRGPIEALSGLADRIAWRGEQDRSGSWWSPADVLLINQCVESAARIESDRFLSQHSAAVKTFFGALALLDRSWGYDGSKPEPLWPLER